MLSRKHTSVSSGIEKLQNKSSKSGRENDQPLLINNPHLKYYALLILSFLSLWLLLFCSTSPNAISKFYVGLDRKLITMATRVRRKPPQSMCNGGAWVYMYELPPEFNIGLLNNCRHLNMHRNMCPHVANHGLGQPISTVGSDIVSAGSSWFNTNQFTAEMIFHARVANHPCRTWDPYQAKTFYVPFYGGLYASSMFRERNLTARDTLVLRLADYLERQPFWRQHHAVNHFLVLGRTAWDFMRTTNSESDYGASCLLTLPRLQNMSALIIERHPWLGSTQHGIPYPSYFHPSMAKEMVAWQKHVKSVERPHLFSFVGSPRIGLRRAASRNEVIRQCAESTQCKLLQCGSKERICNESREVLKVMESSKFCLQPVGDSSTRRSTFDSILAGCIPVFFSPHAAYTQYPWFLPSEPKTYSVYIKLDGNSSRSIEEELMSIPTRKVRAMRGKLIDLIPGVTYASPNASHLGFRDAVDVALAAISKDVDSKLRKDDVVL